MEGRDQPLATDQSQLKSRLAAYLRDNWDKAQRARLVIDPRLIRCKIARKGKYEPGKLAQIKLLYGMDFDPPYAPIISSKCRDTEAWLRDYYLRPEVEAWGIDPEPDIQIPESVLAEMESKVATVLSLEAAQSGQMDAEQVGEQFEAILSMLKSSFKQQLLQKAKLAVERMKRKIEMQFDGGGYDEALKKFIYYLATYPTAFIMGPVQKMKKVQTRQYDPQIKKWKTVVKSEATSTYEAVSPFDVYPMPGVKDIDDGGIFVKQALSPSALSDLINAPGYDTDAIIKALNAYRSGGYHESTNDQAARQNLEDKDSTSQSDDNNMDCLIYQGTVQGQMLIDWSQGVTGSGIADQVDNPAAEYHIQAWIIGPFVIKAMVNPDPMGRKTLSKASLEDDPDNFWGLRALPEWIWDIQTSANAVARGIVLNVGISSGPQIEYNKDRFPDGVSPNFYPMKKWASTGAAMGEGKAVEFYMPPLVADRLTQIFEFFRSLADEHSGIPRYMAGGKDKASSTSSGLSMLIANSARGLKSIATNIDVAIKEIVERQYHFNLQYETDIDIIGDVQIKGKGAAALIAKEQLAIRMKETLDSSNNPVDLEIFTKEGRKKMWKAQLQAMHVNTDDIFPDEQMALQNVLNGGAQAGAGQAPQPAPVQTDAAGDRSGGVDHSLMHGSQNAPEQAPVMAGAPQ